METAGFNKKRNTRIAVSLFFFIQGPVFATWANRIPDINEILGFSDASLGTVLFAIPVGQVSAMVLSGWLVNRFGSRGSCQSHSGRICYLSLHHDFRQIPIRLVCHKIRFV